MKSVNHVFEIAISDAVRIKAVDDVLSDSKNNREHEYWLAHRTEAYRKSKYWIMAYNHFNRNKNHKGIIINDGISKKKRLIVVPTFKELVVQHCVVEALKPMFFRGMYRHTYASVPKRFIFSGNYKANGAPKYIWDKRGTHNGKKIVEKWIKKDPKSCKYCLKMDIRHFFDSIPHDLLKSRICKYIHDWRMRLLLFKIIDTTEHGLPLGFYTSQWLSNWYLQDLDHYIKENLHVKLYIRYNDDMIIFDSNKRRLHEIRKLISNYLYYELGLEMKYNYQVFRFIYKEYDDKKFGRELDFMGFKFYRNRTTLRKSIMIRVSRKARKISKKDRFTVYDARQLMAYNGYLKASDTYNMYKEYIKPYVSFKHLKSHIGKYDKYINRAA